MHPWHDTYVDDTHVEKAFPVIVEIPNGSKNKYELDKETGLLRLDRVLYSAVHYPADYGFIPRTFCDDGDPLDALVLGQEPVYPLTIVEARAIGVMRMRDEKGIDDKLVEKAFPVIVEIPNGSKNKYELDKETGLLRLDRVLYSAVHYPADYGFIPRTFCDDGDPLDALVLGQEPVYPLTIVEARAIGVMRMRDDKGIDDKIIAVNVRDPAVAD